MGDDWQPTTPCPDPLDSDQETGADNQVGGRRAFLGSMRVRAKLRVALSHKWVRRSSSRKAAIPATSPPARHLCGALRYQMGNWMQR